jgi:hypothetical protein
MLIFFLHRNVLDALSGSSDVLFGRGVVAAQHNFQLLVCPVETTTSLGFLFPQIEEMNV